MKSYTLSPGATIEMEADITGISTLYVTTEVKLARQGRQTDLRRTDI